MASPVNDLGCPTCGAALGPYELLCPTCGAKLRQFLTVENLPPRQRELHDIANGAIAQASAHLANAAKLNVKVDLAQDLLAMAKKAAMQGDYSVALDLASKSGAEVGDCEELLEMANEAAIAGDYKSALRYALKAAQRAERGRGQYQAWKVEISDFLK